MYNTGIDPLVDFSLKGIEVKPSEYLQKIYSNIDTPEKWTKGEFARNKDNNRVDPNSYNACKFCIYGAKERADEETIAGCVEREIAMTTFRKNMKQYSLQKGWGVGKAGEVTVIEFNDDFAKHEDISNVFTHSIEQLKSEGY